MSNEEGNKLIAEFMGGKHNGGSFYDFYNGLQIQGTREEDYPSYWGDSVLKYHSSWDWLMPVVIKIGDIPFEQNNGWTEEDYKEHYAYPFPRTFGMKTKEGKYMFRLNACPLFEADTLIEAAWLAVVDYIQSTPATETSANPENKKV